jgi:hypothetical protein
MRGGRELISTGSIGTRRSCFTAPGLPSSTIRRVFAPSVRSCSGLGISDAGVFSVVP